MRAQRFKNDVKSIRPEKNAPHTMNSPPEYYRPGGPAEIYLFQDEHVLFEYNIYWSATILANTILMRLQMSDSTLETERVEAAENICKSIYNMRSFRPFGVMWGLRTLTDAFAVSSLERQEWITEEFDDLYSPMPIRLGPLSMQVGFDYMTGGPLLPFVRSNL